MQMNFKVYMDTDHLKTNIFSELEKDLQQKGFTINKQDRNRPWGGFFVINEDQTEDFVLHFFNEMSADKLKISEKLSPKLLVVAPKKRLSWQYHHRRAEVWRVIRGIVGISTSLTDKEGDIRILNPGDLITLQQGERHRLIGLDSWGVLAEIWQHTDAQNPSDEDDIIRVQDDFGR